MDILSVDERYKKNLTALQPSIDSAVSANNATYKQQDDTVTSLYEGKISEVGQQYDDLERSNAVQKLINEREVAENMANMGLTDSGLNRTQQTAVQLSAANNSAKIARERQTMVNSLTREMTSLRADIELNRSNAETSIKQGYESQAMDAAVKAYNTDVEAWQKNYEATLKAQEEAQKKAAYIIQTNGGNLSRNYIGSLSDNGVDTRYNYDDGGKITSVTYTDNNSGKSTTLDYGVNPYTGTKNKDVENGYFSNGYQPNNVGGVKLKKVTGVNSDPTISINGNQQAIWKAGNKYYFWNGAANKYEQLTDSELKELGIK